MSPSNINTLPPEIIGLILNHLEPVIPTEVDGLTIIHTKPQFKSFSLTNRACRVLALTSLKTFKPKSTAIITGFSSYIDQMKRFLPTSDQQIFRDYFLSQPLSKSDTLVFPSAPGFSSRGSLNDLSHFTFRAPLRAPFPHLRTLLIDDRVHRSRTHNMKRGEMDKEATVGLFNDLALFTLKHGCIRDFELAIEVYTDQAFAAEHENQPNWGELDLEISPRRMVWDGTSLDVPAWRESSTGRYKVDHTFNIDLTGLLGQIPESQEEYDTEKGAEEVVPAAVRPNSESTTSQVIRSFKRLCEGQVGLLNRSEDTSPSYTKVNQSVGILDDSAVRYLNDLRTALIEVLEETRSTLKGDHQLGLTIQGNAEGTPGE